MEDLWKAVGGSHSLHPPTCFSCFPDLYNAGGKQNVIMTNSHKGQKYKSNTHIDKSQNFPFSKSMKENQM